MLQQLDRMKQALTRFGALIFILGVLLRYGTGSYIGTVVAFVGVVFYLIRHSLIMQKKRIL